MRSDHTIWALAVGATVLAAVAALAQTSPDMPYRVTMGNYTMDCGKLYRDPKVTRLFAGVHVTSPQYDLKAESVTFQGTPGQNGPPATGTAEGDPAHNRQVEAQFRDPLNSQAYKVYADRAVYTRDDSRPGGGKVHFTGHVRMYVSSGFLAEPSLTTVEDATVSIGQGEDYPQIEANTVHTVVTPAR